MTTYSIIQKSQLEGAHRLDAEYYQPEYLECRKLMTQIQHIQLGKITSKFKKGIFDIKAETYTRDGIPFVRISNLRDGLIDKNNIAFISNAAHKKEKSTKLVYKDIVLSKTAYPAASLVDLEEVNVSQDIIGISLSDDWKEKILPEFLVAFLNSKYGMIAMKQWFQGNIQMHLSLPDAKTLLIPLFALHKQKIIEKIIEKSIEQKKAAKSFFREAEDLLLEELGFGDFAPEDDLSYIVNFSEMRHADRMDAEYFQPKYDKLIDRLKSKNAISLGDLVSMQKGFEPGSEAYQDDGKLFIRVSSLSKFGIESQDQKYLDEDLYQKLKREYQPQIGEILLTKDATPGIAYVVTEHVESIISGGILRLKLKENIDAEYLALCLNSILGKMQVERDAGGSIIAHWKPEQVKNLLISILPKSTQSKIADLVRKSHEARKKSKELLDEAKRKVEEMIEKGGADEKFN